MKSRLRVKIPIDQVRNEITWIEIEAGEGGYFLFQDETIDSPRKWDSFYATLDEVLSDCENAWGIERHSCEEEDSCGGGRPSFRRAISQRCRFWRR